MSNIDIQCKCGNTFIFGEKDQAFYRLKGFEAPKRCPACRAKKKEQKQHRKESLDDIEDKTWDTCMVCGCETFLVMDTGLCGPCCWGETETINGNW